MTDRIADGIGFSGDVYNPYRFRASLASNTTSAGTRGPYHIVPYDTVVVGADPTFSWNATNFQWTVPLTGTYQIDSVVALNINNNTTFSVDEAMQMYINAGAITGTPNIAAAWGTDSAAIHVHTNGNFALVFADLYPLLQGQVIDMRFSYLVTPDAAYNFQGSGGCYFSAHLISTGV